MAEVDNTVLALKSLPPVASAYHLRDVPVADKSATVFPKHTL